MIMNGPNNALAEVALALAMGFFSIMVLTMVSMGAGGAGSAVLDQTNALKKGLDISVPLAPNSDRKPFDQGAAETVSPSSILIHYQGRFYDAHLNELDPENWQLEEQGVLAIEPNLTMGEALKLRERLKGLDITVTTLDERWLMSLKGMGK